MTAKPKKAPASSAERRSPRQLRSQNTVDAILTAAAKVLASDGFSGTNTNRIAEQAGISVGSLYQYFKNKDEVIAALIAQQAELITSKIQKQLMKLAAEPMPVLVHGLITTFLDVQRAESGFFRVVREEIPRTGSYRRIDQVQKELIDLLAFGIGYRLPALTPGEARMGSFIIVHAIDGITDAALRDDLIGSDYDQLLQETTTLITSYLAKFTSRP